MRGACGCEQKRAQGHAPERRAGKQIRWDAEIQAKDARAREDRRQRQASKNGVSRQDPSARQQKSGGHKMRALPGATAQASDPASSSRAQAAPGRRPRQAGKGAAAGYQGPGNFAAFVIDAAHMRQSIRAMPGERMAQKARQTGIANLRRQPRKTWSNAKKHKARSRCAIGRVPKGRAAGKETSPRQALAPRRTGQGCPSCWPHPAACARWGQTTGPAGRQGADSRAHRLLAGFRQKHDVAVSGIGFAPFKERRKARFSGP